MLGLDINSLVRIVLVTLAVATVAAPLVRRLALRLEVVDRPNERSSHSGVVPRGGGIAIVLAVLVGASVAGSDLSQLLPLVAAAYAFGILGLADDRFGLGVGARLAVQLPLGAVMTVGLLQERLSLNAVGVVATLVSAVLVAGYVNTFNFMDGINGISCAEAIAAGAFFAVLGALRDAPHLTIGGLLIMVAFGGFLPFNVPTARIFLGDVGSFFAGAWLAGLALLSVEAGVPVEVAVIPGIYAIIDTISTLAIRTTEGHRIGEAHRDHAYQRLSRAWGSHSRTSLAVFLVVAAACVLALLVESAGPGARFLGVGAAVGLSVGLFAFGRHSESSTT